MGIPLYFKTITQKYNDIIIDINTIKDINGLFLDLNCAIHPCCRNILKDGYKPNKKAQYEKRMINEVLNYIDKLVNLIHPKLVYLAIDGVAPAAKMQQQRLRRYKTILEKKETNIIKKKFNQEYDDESWDTNAISPGTEFMNNLALMIEQHIKIKEIYKSKDVIFSSANVPGEGEHKIFNFIKETQIQGNNVVYGLDADLIMLSIASKKSNIYLLREAIEFGNKVNMDRFLYLDIDELKSYLSSELLEKFIVLNQITVTDEKVIENFTYDYVFICYFLGNDFLPHLASVSLKNDGLDQIMDIYMQTYYHLQQNFIDSEKCKINSLFMKHFLLKLSELEYDNIKLMLHQRNKFSLKYKKYDSEYFKHLDLLNNYPMFNRENEKSIEIEKKGWQTRYYLACFGCKRKSEINNICHNYFEGLKWTCEYYFKDCVSWQWRYNYRHGPLLKDLSNYLNQLKDINKIKLNKGIPNNSLVQLLTILPYQSRQILPKTTHELMTSLNSNIVGYYPQGYVLDTIFKRYYWQCVPILPLIDYKKVKDAISEIKLTKQEKVRFSKSIPICKKSDTSILVI